MLENKKLDNSHMEEVNDIYELIELFEELSNSRVNAIKITEDTIIKISSIIYNIKDNLDPNSENVYRDMKNVYNFFVFAEQILDKQDFLKIVKNMNLDKDGYSFIMEDLINFRKFIGDFVPDIIKTGSITSVKLHQAIKKKNTSNHIDLFLSEFKRSSIAAMTELTTKVDNLQESGWISYILKDGGEKNNIIHQNLIKSYQKILEEKSDYNDRKNFADALNDLYRSVSIHMITTDENGKSDGYQISKLDFTKNLNILKISGKNQADSVVIGCPYYEHTKNILFISFASSDDDKLSQNRQWVKHLEGIIFSIVNNLNNFENIKDVKATVISLASLNDDETLNFKNYKLSNKEISSFRKINEIAELFKCFVEYNHRFSELCSMINMKFIGSHEEINLRNKNKEQIRDLILENLETCVIGLNNALEKDKYMFHDLDSKKKKQYINSIKSIIEEAQYYIKPNEKLNNLVESSILLFDNLTKYAGINEYKSMKTNLENYLKNPNQYYELNEENNSAQNDYKFVKNFSRLNEIFSNIENYNNVKTKEIKEIETDIENKINNYIKTKALKDYYINNNYNKFENLMKKNYDTSHLSNEDIASFLNLSINSFNQYKSSYHNGNHVSGYTNITVMKLISFLPKLNGMTHKSDRENIKSQYYEKKLSVVLKNMKNEYKENKDLDLFVLIKEVETSITEINKIRNSNKKSILHKIKNSANDIVRQFGTRRHISLNDSGINFASGFLDLIKPILADEVKNSKLKKSKKP